MKNIFTFSSLICCFSLYGQVTWCPPGAVWHYTYAQPTHYGFCELSYEKDTVFDGESCHKLIEYIEYIDYFDYLVHNKSNIRYTYESGGVVFTHDGNAWDTIFNFNAVPGERWGQMFSSGNGFVEVQDTGHRVIQGENLKWMTVTYTNSLGGTVTDSIFERMGCGGFNYPFEASISVTDPEIHNFCNYSDDTFSDWNNPDTVCRSLPTTGIETQSIFMLEVFPNPSQEFVTLSFDLGQSGLARLVMTDLTGRILLTKEIGTLVAGSHQIPVSLTELPAQVYFCTLSIDGQAISRKIIKVD